jgi:hypothetical protein
MRNFSVFFLMPVLAGAQTICEAPDPSLRMNEIQVIGTHNSYHLRPPDTAMTVLRAFTREVDAWDYSHPPLDVQLERGVRSLELDLQWRDQRWEVFHVPGVDEGSTCPLFEDCLRTVQAWSAANPGHVPISFLLEIKDDVVYLDHRITIAPPEALDLLDTQVRGIFTGDSLITPDRVRGDAPTLETAVTTQGWPRLEDVRGTVMFILHERGEHRDHYAEGRPSLEGRAMFVRSEPGRPDAATIVMDHPNPEAIQPVVRAGYFVRTRADGGLRYSPERRQAAFDSGAHIVTTDFPPGSPSKKSGYTVAFDDGAPARINPVMAAR